VVPALGEALEQQIGLGALSRAGLRALAYSLAAGVAPANAGSVGCLRKTGFRPLDPEPDWEGVVYYCRFRHPVTVEAHDRTVSP
jgi:hypothetical protein